MMLNVDKQAKINMIDLNINRFDADYILLTEFTRINSKKKKQELDLWIQAMCTIETKHPLPKMQVHYGIIKKKRRDIYTLIKTYNTYYLAG